MAQIAVMERSSSLIDVQVQKGLIRSIRQFQSLVQTYDKNWDTLFRQSLAYRETSRREMTCCSNYSDWIDLPLVLKFRLGQDLLCPSLSTAIQTTIHNFTWDTLFRQCLAYRGTGLEIMSRDRGRSLERATWVHSTISKLGLDPLYHPGYPIPAHSGISRAGSRGNDGWLRLQRLDRSSCVIKAQMVKVLLRSIHCQI